MRKLMTMLLLVALAISNPGSVVAEPGKITARARVLRPCSTELNQVLPTKDIKFPVTGKLDRTTTDGRIHVWINTAGPDSVITIEYIAN